MYLRPSLFLSDFITRATATRSSQNFLHCLFASPTYLPVFYHIFGLRFTLTGGEFYSFWIPQPFPPLSFSQTFWE